MLTPLILNLETPGGGGGVTLAGTVLTIGGVERTMLNGWNLRMSANGRATLNCEIMSPNGAYRPAQGDVVTLTDNGTLVFGGNVHTPRESGLGSDVWSTIKTAVTAVDYNSIAERRHIDGTFGPGTLKSILTSIVAILSFEGVTLDGSQADGPTISQLVLSDVRCDAVLNNLTTLTGGWPWSFSNTKVLSMQDPTIVSAPFPITATNGKAIGDVEVEPNREGYANTVIVKSANFRKSAFDAGHVDAQGAWEVIYTALDETPEAVMQDLADSILARSLVVPKWVWYKTLTSGLKPGMAQTINLPHRNLNNTFLIMEVHLRQTERNIHYYYVNAVEGTVYRQDWRETYRIWGGTSTGSASGGVVAGGGGGTSAPRSVYLLAATGIAATRSPTPTWVPADSGVIGQGSVQVQIDTAFHGTTTATVKARLRVFDAGVSVQARLYDVTAAAAVPGTSSVVTDTSWVNVAFSVTLNAGNHFYELQLLPGSANADVAGTGYLEIQG